MVIAPKNVLTTMLQDRQDCSKFKLEVSSSDKPHPSIVQSQILQKLELFSLRQVHISSVF